MSFGKLLPSATAYRETFESAKHLSIVDGDIFDCVLAYTCMGNVDTLWTENTKHFKKYSFLKVENPLKMEMGRKIIKILFLVMLLGTVTVKVYEEAC